MFEQTSRYYNISTSSITILNSEGKNTGIKYIKRRFLPSPDSMTTLAEHIVKQEDRLDNITTIYLGDASQFWQICDANGILKPEELTEEIGQTIRISMPKL